MTKRLCFALFCADPKHILNCLSAIQEKVVEILRQNAGAPFPELFFLWRVLLFKLGYEAMTSLWPIILTEIVPAPVRALDD